jgi:hypothetical protein
VCVSLCLSVQVGLTIVHMLAGVVWLWSSMVVDEHLKPTWLSWMRGSDFSLCVFWAHWCQVCSQGYVSLHSFVQTRFFRATTG